MFVGFIIRCSYTIQREPTMHKRLTTQSSGFFVFISISQYDDRDPILITAIITGMTLMTILSGHGKNTIFMITMARTARDIIIINAIISPVLILISPALFVCSVGCCISRQPGHSTVSRSPDLSHAHRVDTSWNCICCMVRFS